MKAKVLNNFHDNSQDGKLFKKDETWTGTRARFEEINTISKEKHKKTFLQDLEEKETKERKLNIEKK